MTGTPGPLGSGDEDGSGSRWTDAKAGAMAGAGSGEDRSRNSGADGDRSRWTADVAAIPGVLRREPPRRARSRSATRSQNEVGDAGPRNEIRHAGEDRRGVAAAPRGRARNGW